MGIEGCLRAKTCCGQHLVLFGVSTLENMLVKKKTTILIDWTHRMLSMVHVFEAPGLLMENHHEMDLKGRTISGRMSE